jgi:molecular chaperone GrpE
MSRSPTNDDFDTGVDPEDLEANEGLPEALPAGPSEEEFMKLKEERDSLFERYARAQADFQNSRKRLEAEADTRLQYANANLLKSLLPVLDNLERAVAVDIEKADAKSIIKGLQVLMDQIQKVLKAAHVEVIEPKPGTPFDPKQHEALMQQPSDDYDPNTVTQLLQKGYTLRDRTLRPAQVAVSKGG